jgi:ATP-dependent metalloprotease FtsH
MTKMLSNICLTISTGTTIFIAYTFYQMYNPKTVFNVLYPNKKNLTFNDIIGLSTVKLELKHYLLLITSNLKHQYSVKLPKGILLLGRPGVGKTLLVKTLASEMNLPIIYTAGSEFIETYVGVGPRRIRQLFEKARQLKNCIVFIDEIDSIGAQRGTGFCSEQARTLNQLLVEIDGMKSMGNHNIILIGATNNESILDLALLRSGRFDKKIYFDLPNFNERQELFTLYLKNIDVTNLSFVELSKKTANLSGADINNICNQAKIQSLKKSDKLEMTMRELDYAIDELMIGREKIERKMSNIEQNTVAHHEAGHALMSYILRGQTPPVKVSIIPRGEKLLGFSQQENEDHQLYTNEFILGKICILLSGRISEEVCFDTITTGSYDDIEKISDLLHDYVYKYGFDSPLNYTKFKLSDTKVNLLNTRIEDISNKCYQFSKKIIITYKDEIELLGKLLLEKETIVLDDINDILDPNLMNSVICQI